MIEHLPHTADVRVRITAESAPELFADALRALFEILGPSDLRLEATVRTTVAIEAPDPTSLLVDFLNDVLWRAHVERAVFQLVRFVTLSGTALRAELEATPADAFSDDVKAVTYHEAEVRRTEDGHWQTLLVFDI